jgi:D-alanine-D-alanine ligase-like ATP-grasp enzyme
MYNLILFILFLILLYLFNKYKKLEGGNIFLEILQNVSIELNLKYILENKSITIYNKEKSVSFKSSQKNNIEDKKYIKIVNDKKATTDLLCKHNYNCLTKILVDSPKTINDISNIINNVNKNLNYPIVVKPNNSCCGILVFINILNENELFEILKNNFLNIKYSKIILEDFILGNSYRILCYKNEILDIYIRKLPYIIGNNINTIEELVNTYNINNKNKKGILDNVVINESYLKKKNLNSKSILNKNEKTLIFELPKKGSILKRININSVHKDNINIFKTLYNIFNIKLFGIDLIIPDITKSYKVQKYSILELNKNPSLMNHYIIDKKNHIIKKVIQSYFTN